MKKLVSLIVVAAAFSVSMNAQSILDKLGSLGNVISNAAGVIYSAPISLNGTYTYNGVAVSATSSEGGLLTNLAGTAATSAIETKADGYLSKVGIKPGAMSFTFNSEDKTFTLNVGKLSIPGTFTVGDGEKTISLVFGKKFQYLSMTGSLESSLGNVKMVFPVNKAMALIKKIASTLGQSSSGLGSIVKLADGYDNFRLGFKMSK
ncbi:MAG: DUF4923 family protein [Bacteroidales bacterium]|nr:DUF4923 family protein [Bacteroidales bacterium]